MLVLMALIRDFVFTAIITNAFKVAVKGSVTMLIAVRKIRRALTSDQWQKMAVNLPVNTRPRIEAVARRLEGFPFCVFSLEFVNLSLSILPASVKLALVLLTKSFYLIISSFAFMFHFYCR